MSVAQRNALLNLRYGSVTYTPASTLYLAAFLVNPSMPDGTGFTEVTADGYARLQITNNATNFPDAANGVKTNGVDFEWATATAAWGNVIGIGIFTVLTAGAPIDWFSGATATINIGNSLRIRAGQLQMSLLPAV